MQKGKETVGKGANKLGKWSQKGGKIQGIADRKGTSNCGTREGRQK